MKSRVTGYSLWTWPLVDLDTFTDKRKKKKKRLTLIYGSLPALIRMSKGSGCEKVCAGLSLSLSVFLCPRWTPLVFWTACKRDCDSVLSAIKEILGWEGPLSEQRSGGWNCQRDLGILSENNWVFMRVVFFFFFLVPELMIESPSRGLLSQLLARKCMRSSVLEWRGTLPVLSPSFILSHEFISVTAAGVAAAAAAWLAMFWKLKVEWPLDPWSWIFSGRLCDS